MKLIITLKVAVIATLTAGFSALSYGQTESMALDQQNDNFGNYFNNQTTVWQSFTAGTNGFLTAIQAHIYATSEPAWAATLEIRQGSGVGGTLLTAQSVSGNNTNQERTFVLLHSIRQLEGEVYSFVVRDATVGITARASPDHYAGGRSLNAKYDLNFKTWIVASEWSEAAWRDTSFTASSTIINTPAKLAQFAWLVNNGNSFEGRTVTLSADIDLSRHLWVPIGTEDYPFQGRFNGAGHCINGLYIDNSSRDQQGLFGYFFDYGSSAIENVVVTNLDITARDKVGGIAGVATGTVRDCTVFGNIAGRDCVGGVAGKSKSYIRNCAVVANVSGRDEIGGVVGSTEYHTVEGCQTAGKVIGDSYTGGVVGLSEGQGIYLCVNHAEVTASTNYCGGVVGYTLGPVENCVSYGTINGFVEAGGVAGQAFSLIQNCVNEGDVYGMEYSGGIVGVSKHDIRNCRNRGYVWSTSMAGGICGSFANFTAKLINCHNSGEVQSLELAGGIAGTTAFGRVINCSNQGHVMGTFGGARCAGGIVGQAEKTLIHNCANTGTIKTQYAGNSAYVGGLVALATSGTSIINSINVGSVLDPTAISGALVGNNRFDCTVNNCFWKQTGVEPYIVDATGANDGTLLGCQTFGEAPGRLAAPVTIEGQTTDDLAQALNIWVVAKRGITEGNPFRRWASGSSESYPAVITSYWTDEGNYETEWYSPEASSFYIDSAAKLAGVAVLVNNGVTFIDQRIILSQNIALDAHEWVPIGKPATVMTSAQVFSGIFDGNGKTIAGLYVDGDSAVESAGLFGVLANAVVVNTALSDADVMGMRAGGAIAGYSSEASIVANNSCRGLVGTPVIGSGDTSAGGIAGLISEGTQLFNCWSDVVVDAAACGGIVGTSSANISDQITHCYWKQTGTSPYNLPAIADGMASNCYAFTEAPGLLDLPPGAPPLTLSQALNSEVASRFEVNGVVLYGWTAGSTAHYPMMTAQIRIGREPIAETLSEGFAAGMPPVQADNLVGIYIEAYPETTVATLGKVMQQADLLGLTLLALRWKADAILDFAPHLAITAFNPHEGELTFTVSNGIDATPTQAMNRLAAAPATGYTVLQMSELGGDGVSLSPTIQHHDNGTATATFIPYSAEHAFFKLCLVPALD